MTALEGLSTALETLLQWNVLFFFLLGVLNGMVFGILPGLSGSVGIALMVPLTFGMEAEPAIVMFVAALSGQNFSGSISAILLNTPGTSPNAATTLDGYPLTQRGRGGYAIGISAAASTLGAVIGIVILVLLIPLVRQLILTFSFPEFAMFALLGLAAVSIASRGSMFKGLMAAAFGVLLSLVGFSVQGGELRYVFGLQTLWDGVDVIAVLIGLFGLSEAAALLVRGESIASRGFRGKVSSLQALEGVRYVFTKPWLLIRSSVLGTAIGIIPAVGGTVASFLAYFSAAKSSKNGRFGRGDPRGVLAPEAANDGKDAGAALPTLAFGLPGSADWAIILGALVLHGVTPGPNLIREEPGVIWISVIVILAASFTTSVIGVGVSGYLLPITRLRPGLVAPVVIVLAVVGAYALQRQTLDVFVVIMAGLLGYFMKRAEYPIVPLVLGVLLGGIVESQLLQSLDVLGEGMSVFVTRPYSLVLLLLTLLLVGSEIVGMLRRRSSEEVQANAQRASRDVLGIVLATFFGIAGLVGIVGATGFSEQGRMFPLYSSAVLVTLSVAYIAIALIPAFNRRFGSLIAGSAMSYRLETERIDDLVDTSPPDETKGAGAGATANCRLDTTEAATLVEEEPLVAPGRPKRPGRQWIVLVALLGLLTAYLLVGLAAAVPLFLVLTMRYIARERWALVLPVAAGVLAFMYTMFVVILNLQIDLPL